MYFEAHGVTVHLFLLPKLTIILFFLQFYKQFWIFLLFLWDNLGIFINCTVATVTLSGVPIFEATYFLKFPSTKYAKKKNQRLSGNYPKDI